jgi:hypothetical protein
VAEIRYWHQRFAVTDFAFYNGALLVDAARHALPILEGIVRAGLKVVAAEMPSCPARQSPLPGSGSHAWQARWIDASDYSKRQLDLEILEQLVAQANAAFQLIPHRSEPLQLFACLPNGAPGSAFDLFL